MSNEASLQRAINDWLQERPTRSISQLARQAGVSYSSAWRAAQGDTVSSQTVAIAIASLTMNALQFQDFVGDHYPALKSVVCPSLPEPAAEPTDLAQSPEYFKVLMLASSPTGTDEEEVIRKFGEKELTLFEDLKNSGELVQRNNRWYFEKIIRYSSPAKARANLAMLSSECDPKNDHITDASYAVVGWMSLSKDAVAQLYKKIDQFNNEILTLVLDPENKGPIVAAYGLLHNIFKGQEHLR